MELVGHNVELDGRHHLSIRYAGYVLTYKPRQSHVGAHETAEHGARGMTIGTLADLGIIATTYNLS